MKVYATRDSVCAGDDADAPHPFETTVPDGASLETMIATLIRSGYLPNISGGCATWSVSSGVPIAVIAQQWNAPRMLDLAHHNWAGLDASESCLRMHFSYFTQQDPESVCGVLERLRLRAL